MRLQPLLSCLADGQFHSGRVLGERLGLSRAAIWKQVQGLKALGVEVCSVPGRGYRIPGGLDLLDRERITARLAPAVRDALTGFFEVHLSVGSTNAEAMAVAARRIAPMLVIAEHQASGRGRRGKAWVSPFGHNLYLSLVWRFQGGVSALEGLSLACGLAVVTALKHQGFDGFELKWPNDVLYQGRKLAGILLEVTGDLTDSCHVVIGIGVNTHMPQAAGQSIDQPYSELGAIAAVNVDRNALCAALINALWGCLAVFQVEGFRPFRKAWQELDRYHGQLVEIHTGQGEIAGRAVGVDDFGRLLLETSGGVITISGGELMPSLRPVAQPLKD